MQIGSSLLTVLESCLVVLCILFIVSRRLPIFIIRDFLHFISMGSHFCLRLFKLFENVSFVSSRTDRLMTDPAPFFGAAASCLWL